MSGRDVPGGIVEYLIAFGNEQLRCVEFCDAIVERLSAMVSSKYASAINKSMDEAMSGFLETGTYACKCLLDLVFNDMQSVFKQLFCPEWYSEDHVLLLVETMKDYGDDFNDHLKDFLYNRITTDMMDRLLVEYVGAMRNKNVIFRMPSSKTRFRGDLEMLQKYFELSVGENKVVAALAPAEQLLKFALANQDKLFFEYMQLKKKYPDFELDFAEVLLSHREDIKEAVLKDVMANFRSKAEPKAKVEQPSLFSKLPH